MWWKDSSGFGTICVCMSAPSNFDFRISKDNQINAPFFLRLSLCDRARGECKCTVAPLLFSKYFRKGKSAGRSSRRRESRAHIQPRKLFVRIYGRSTPAKKNYHKRKQTVGTMEEEEALAAPKTSPVEKRSQPRSATLTSLDWNAALSFILDYISALIALAVTRRRSISGLSGPTGKTEDLSR